MPKVIIQLGFDLDLFAEIEEKRGGEPRTTYVNKKLREIMMPASAPMKETPTSHDTP